MMILEKILSNNRIGATILRVILSFLILKDFIISFNNREYLFDDKGIVSYDIYLSIVNYFNIDWIYIDFNNPLFVKLFCIFGIIFSVLFFIGIFKRFSALILFFLLFLFKIRNIYMVDGGDNVILVILPFMVFVQSYSFIERYDDFINRFTKGIKSVLNTLSRYFVFAIIIQICIIYLFASMHKLQGLVWRDGTALYYILNSYDFKVSFLNEWISESIFLIKLLTWTTIIFQFTFPFLIWFRNTKNIIVLLGIFFHIGIFLLMRVDNFSFIMIACYAILFSDEEYLNINIKVRNLWLRK